MCSRYFFPLFFSWREEGGLLYFLGSEEWDLLPKQKYGVVSALLAARCEPLPFSTMGDRAASSLVRLLFWGLSDDTGRTLYSEKVPFASKKERHLGATESQDNFACAKNRHIDWTIAAAEGIFEEGKKLAVIFGLALSQISFVPRHRPGGSPFSVAIPPH